jgi:hypothetical protein
MKTIATIVDRHGMTTVVLLRKSIHDVLNDNAGWELRRDLADDDNSKLTGSGLIACRRKLHSALQDMTF